MPATKVHTGRHRAELDGDFVVFLIGMRINHPLRVRKWWPVFLAMPRMLRELEQDPASGLLAHRLTLAGPRSPLVVQYWRSFDHLERFARDPGRSHLPAWRAFASLIGYEGDDVGIWHETYRVRAGEHESIYGNMPRLGLAAAGELVPLGSTSRARRRFRAQEPEPEPQPEPR
jgi:hypothetical protein